MIWIDYCFWIANEVIEMSVICQNFVQNAWKKDLCSNCFKSFGDHDHTLISAVGDQNGQVCHDNAHENGKVHVNGLKTENGTQKFNVSSRDKQQESTPQTTWKSLIAERNVKNTQPFTLEKGFHGRLLTINTANTVLDIKTTNVQVESISNTGKSKHDRNLTSKSYRKVETVATTPKEILESRKVLEGGILAPSDESNCIDMKNSKSHEHINLNGSQKSKKNGLVAPLQGILKTKVYSEDDITTNQSNEEQTDEVNGDKVLHSILKNGCMTEIKSPRVSSVGFKDEDPVVIGYGGRDFTPEELEWEMASSDGEGGGAISDETEDDRAFSKITKANTEFNSYNKNLLQKCNIEEEECYSSSNNGEKINKQSELGIKLSKKVKNGSTASIWNLQKRESKAKNETKSTFRNTDGTYKETKSSLPEVKSEIRGYDLNNKNSNTLADETSNEIKQLYTEKAGTICENSSITFANANSCAISNNDVVVEKRTKFSSSTSPSRGASIAATCELSAVVKNRCKRKTTRSQAVSVANNGDGEFFDFEKDDASLGSSHKSPHEAINTALANKRRMEYEDKPDNIVTSLVNDFENISVFKNTQESKAILDVNSSSSKTTASKCSDSETKDATKSELDAVELLELASINSEEVSRESLEPRSSFLHGFGSDSKEQASKPSAIYSPGSDFFVKRSSSCSSSSSDDINKSQDNLNVSSPDTARTVENVSNTDGIGSENESNDFKNESESISGQNSHEAPETVKTSKAKPKVPEKPPKPSITFRTCNSDSGHYAKPISRSKEQEKEKSDSSNIYYSVVENLENGFSGNSEHDNHYAEASIYQEVDGKTIANTVNDPTKDDDDVNGDSKYGEQTRSGGSNTNFKRQAPSPPKMCSLSDDSTRSLDRSPSPTNSQNVGSFRENNLFSSASSTTSSSSQDDPGFGSWSLHGDPDESRKSSKWKNSFLAAQYSKCKMLAMNYNDDRFKARKKFSLKKLLKIGKDSELPVNITSNENNPKAWKFSESFERPRAKLEIIHPMDLENKSVTVNPGFHPVRSNSTSSFSSGVEIVSIKPCASSDYGSYYSDAASTVECQAERNYVYINPENCEAHSTLSSSGRETPCSALNPSGSTSPTPSRCSANSQASTITSGSSKNGVSCGQYPARPPKPPPPPRAHSLLPGNNTKNSSCKSSENEQVPLANTVAGPEEVKAKDADLKQERPPKPQAPKRLYRACNGKSDSSNSEVRVPLATSATENDDSSTRNMSKSDATADENPYECVQTDTIAEAYEDIETFQSTTEKCVKAALDDDKKPAFTPIATIDPRTTVKFVEMSSKKQVATKAPSRPPPIYSKLPSSAAIGKDNPWKTLEGSYAALSTNNKDVLGRLVEQGVNRRPGLKLKGANHLEWADFKLDPSCRPLFFAFGDRIAYDAALMKMGNHAVTLLASLQIPDSNPLYQYKYPVISNFIAEIPGHLVLEDGRSDLELENIPALVYVLQKSEVDTMENFVNNMPDVLTETLEKEICFLLLQVIQELKCLQAQGIEEIEPNFSNLVLAKTPDDVYHSLVFLAHNFSEDSGNAYSLVLEECKVSLCQFALMLLFQLFKVESIEELAAIGGLKFTNSSVTKVFESTARLLLEEKAVSLSQVKMLLESFMWGLQTLVLKPDFDLKEADVILYRWIDIERSNFIRNVVTNALTHINTHAELHSQFLLRSNVKNIKDIIPYL